MAEATDVYTVRLESDPGAFVSGMQRASAALDMLAKAQDRAQSAMGFVNRRIDEAVNSVRKIGATAAAAGGTLTGFMVMGTRAAASFQAQMLNVNTVARMSAGSLAGLSQQVLTLSRALPQSADDLARGLYDISSSGFQGQEAMKVLEASAMAATGGLTTTATAAQGVTAILNAYGMSASHATDVSDILFETVNYGVITFEEMASTLGEWVGMASAAGIAADEASAALATMTLSGINAAEASTSLNRLMQSFIDPSEELSSMVRSMGYESALAFLETNRLSGAMTLLAQETGGSVEAMTQLFPEIRAARGAFALANDGGVRFADITAKITDESGRAGAAQEAFATQSQGLNMQLKLLWNQITALGIGLTNSLIKPMTIALKPLIALVDGLNNLPGPIKAIIGAAVAFGAAILTMAGLFVMLFAKAIVWQFVMGKVATAIGVAAKAMGASIPAAIGWSAALDKVSMAAARAATAHGPLGAAIGGARSAMSAAGISATGAGISMGGMAAAAGIAALKVGALALVAGGAVVAYNTFTHAAEKARRAGEEWARELSESISANTVGEMQEKMDTLVTELERLEDWQNRSSTFEGVRQIIDLLGSGDENAEGKIAGLRREIAALEEEILRIEGAAAEAILSATGLAQSFDVRDPERSLTALAEAANDVGLNSDRAVAKLVRLAEQAGVDLSQPTRFLIDTLEELWNTSGDATANTEGLQTSIIGLGEEAETATDKIERLEDVFSSAMDSIFGTEIAEDQIQDTLNGIYERVQDIKEAGTLGDAMDLASFHEDAIGLRSEFRGLVDDVFNRTVAEASSKNMTGLEVLDYLREQADLVREAGREMGLSEEFIDRYAQAILEIANMPEIAVEFNDNLETAEGRLQAYLAELGLADTEVITAVDVYKTEGEVGLRDWLSSLRTVDDEQIDTIINLVAEDAYADLEAWRQAMNLEQEEVTQLVRIAIENPEELEAALGELGLEGQDWQAFLEIVGAADSELALQTILQMLESVDTTTGEPTVDTSEMTPALTTADQILARLQEIDSFIASPIIAPRVQPGETPLLVPSSVYDREAQVAGSGAGAAVGIFRNARGGLYPQILSPRDGIRMWNEPAAQGEAYIPFNPSVRGRALGIWMAAGKRLGVMGYDQGGYSGPTVSARGGERQYPLDLASRQRPSQSSSTRSGASSKSSSVEKAAKAAKDAARDLWSAIKNAYDVGDISAEQLRDLAGKRMAQTDRYSSEWMDAWRTVERLDEEMQDRLEESKREASKRFQDNLGIFQTQFELGEFNTEEYAYGLMYALSLTEKFSDDWYAAWSELRSLTDELVGSLPDSVFSAFDSSAFTESYVSPKQVSRYYEKRAKDAADWVNIVTRLASQGVATPILQDLVQGGLDSLPMARALERMVTDGTINALNSNVNKMQQLDAQFRAVQAGPMAGAFGRQPINPATLDALVKITNAEFNNGVDLELFLRELSFQTQSGAFLG